MKAAIEEAAHRDFPVAASRPARKTGLLIAQLVRPRLGEEADQVVGVRGRAREVADALEIEHPRGVRRRRVVEFNLVAVDILCGVLQPLERLLERRAAGQSDRVREWMDDAAGTAGAHLVVMAPEPMAAAVAILDQP